MPARVEAGAIDDDRISVEAEYFARVRSLGRPQSRSWRSGRGSCATGGGRTLAPNGSHGGAGSMRLLTLNDATHGDVMLTLPTSLLTLLPLPDVAAAAIAMTLPPMTITMTR